MFDEDAEDSKERAEQGRKNMEFRDFYNSVKLEIRNEANAGNNRATYIVSQRDRELVEELMDRLTEENFEIEFVDGPRPTLKISWDYE